MIAASCRLEEEALDRIRNLHDECHILNCFSPEYTTLDANNMLFKMLSRQAARFEELRDLHANSCPFIPFLILHDGDLGKASLWDHCEHSRDEWIASLIEDFWRH